MAPAQFSFVAPQWLLLQSPEDWGAEAVLGNFLARYQPRLRLFLDILKACEDRQVAKRIPRDSMERDGTQPLV